ncbi:Gfo/Idh/MocA family oxidoreductase [Bacillus testis]|uniref:Gfo/Idh/MocA family oxidoreductase n=1 Tax=Bacillus testis TaxID=1622072 RepID=UPI00067EBCE1|nr:Gfo/Idh/MocA family oxidoreductase [Bacillus testis]
MIRIGIIGADSTHAVAFTEQLTNALNPYHVPGGEVIGFYSAEPSIDQERKKDIEKKLIHQYGLVQLASFPQMADRCDAFLLLTVHPYEKQAQLKGLLNYNKPVFIDKPISLTAAEAIQLERLSHKAKTPIMSSSALRFVTAFENFKNTYTQTEEAIQFNGPLLFHSSIPGYFWYGIHLAEMVVSLMGGLPEELSVKRNGGREIVECVYNHQLVRMVFENRGDEPFSLKLNNRTIPLASGSEPIYTGLLKNIMAFFQTGHSTVPFEETIDVMRMLESMNKQSEAYARFSANKD